MQTDNYDLIINGGGLVGASLACALAGDGFKVALIEASAYTSTKQPSFDTRALALTYSAGTIFRNLNIWQKLSFSQATAIRHIEVSDEAGDGCVRLFSRDVGREALGWNVEARALGMQILEVLEKCSTVTLFSPMTIRKFEFTDGGVVAEVAEANSDHTNRLSAKLLVIADGSNSKLSAELSFVPRRVEYRQRALVCRIETDRLNRGGAFEYFTKSGPLALLPFGDKGYSVVWTQEPDNLKKSLEQSRSDFLASLQTRIGDRAGQFESLIGERKTYPLILSHLKKFVRPRVVVVGNASHTVHPVAGQGFNLALRDVAALAEVLGDHQRRGWDIGSYDVLVKYENWRAREGSNVTWFTDGMIQLFANDLPMLTPVRNLGLDLLQTFPSAKRWLLERTMGLHGRQPKLAKSEK